MGSATSGNRGHGGRPGLRGGSAPGAGRIEPTVKVRPQWEQRMKVVDKKQRDLANEKDKPAFSLSAADVLKEAERQRDEESRKNTAAFLKKAAENPDTVAARKFDLAQKRKYPDVIPFKGNADADFEGAANHFGAQAIKLGKQQEGVLGTGVEVGIAYRDDGSVIAAKRGVRHHVEYSVAETKEYAGSSFIHNHPGADKVNEGGWRSNGGGSLSPGDVIFANRIGLKRITAVSPKYIYTLRPPEGETTFGKNEESVQIQYNLQRTNGKEKFVRENPNHPLIAKTPTPIKYAEAMMTPDQWEEHTHWVTERVAKRFNYRYERIPRKKTT